MNKKIAIILIGVLIPLILYFLPTSLGGDTEILVVEGQSMYPTILPGSLVITKTAPTYEIGDIVSFTLKEENIQRIVVHRIVGETEEGFIIQGDNNPRKDPGFPTMDDIRGEVIFATPYIGELFELLRNPIVLVGTAVVTLLIQAEQKRRRKKKEKLRRILLGLPPRSDKLGDHELNKKQKKPDYSLFYIAIAFNILTYVLIQVSIVYDLIHLRDMGDVATGFLYKMFAPSFASTLSFCLYFVFIFGLYFLTKVFERRAQKSKRSSGYKSGSTLKMLIGKDLNPMLLISQFLWIMFILMSMFHLLGLSQNLIQTITDPCDPTKELC